jgi:hypothetical protein
LLVVEVVAQDMEAAAVQVGIAQAQVLVLPLELNMQ